MMVSIKRAWKILPLNSVSTIINASPNIWKIEKTQATNIQKYLQILFESFQSLNFSATQQEFQGQHRGNPQPTFQQSGRDVPSSEALALLMLTQNEGHPKYV